MRNHKTNITIKDVAADVGVSIATVSRVLNQLPSVSKATVRKVEEAIDRLGYQTQGGKAARDVRSPKGILIVLPTISNPFFSPIVNSVIRSLTLVGRNVDVCISNYSAALEKAAFQRLMDGEYDGLISFYTDLSADYLQTVADSRPYVMVSHHVEGLDACCVSIDDQKAMYEATEYLLDQGHTKIALISGNKGGDVLKERGYLQAHQAYGIQPNPAYFIRSIRQYGFEFEMGARHSEYLLNLPDPPTAILSVYDAFAIGAVKYALSRDIAVGKDLAVIGFDNASFSKVFIPSLSTIVHPVNELGVTATDLLLHQIQTGDLKPRQVYLPHELIIRDSSQ